MANRADLIVIAAARAKPGKEGDLEAALGILLAEPPQIRSHEIMDEK